MADYPIKIDVGYEENASRLEALIIRWVYAIFLVIVIEVWGLIAVIVLFFNWLHILILGKRNQGMHNFITGFFRFYTRVYGYLFLLTDERPPLSGQ
jgi:hypothetical protein